MQWILVYLPALTVTAGLMAIERWRGAPRTDWLRNLQAWGVMLAVSLLVLPLLPLWSGHALIAGAALPLWAGLLIFLFVQDLSEYLFHRAQHRVGFLWAMHSLHHSDPEMAVLTTNRHFWGDQLIKRVTVWSATLMIISPTTPILTAYGFISLWNLFTHCDLPIDFGRWSWVINSPAYHRRHHSSLPEHYDSNFAAIFPIFDVIFGDYHRPEGFPPTGLLRKPESLTNLVIWPLIWDKAAEVVDSKVAMLR